MLKNKKINPYLMALFTTLLSVVGASITSFQITAFQAAQAVATRKAACRKEMYANFLSRIDRKNDLRVSELLSIGALAGKATTDSETQDLENQFSKVLAQNSPKTVYVKLNSDLNLLRLCGSKAVTQQAEDLLNVLIGDFSAVDVSHYPSDFRQYYQGWLKLQQGQHMAYGWEERISSEERASLILISAMLRQLLATMNSELEK